MKTKKQKIYPIDYISEDTAQISIRMFSKCMELPRVVKPKTTAIEFIDFCNLHGIKSNLTLIEIIAANRNFLKNWEGYIIPRAKDKYPFVDKFELSTLGNIIYSHSYYFFSISKGWIDVDKDAYVRRVASDRHS